MAVINTSNITSILDANKIKYNSKIKTFRQIAFTSEAIQTFAEESIKNLETIVIAGVNGGFKDKRYIEAVQDLIDSLVNLGDRNAQKKFEKIKKEIKEIEGMIMANVDKSKNQIDVRTSIKKWLETTLEGVDVLLNQVDGETHKATLEKARTALVELREGLISVTDYSSKQAADYAMEIVNQLMDFREKASKREFNDFTLDHLINALNQLTEWQELKQGTSFLKNPVAKESDLPVYMVSNFDKILLCDKLMNKMKSFNENIETFNSEIKERYDIDGINAEINEVNQEKVTIEQEVLKIKNLAQNGKMSVEQAKRQIQLKMGIYNRTKEKLARLQAQLAKKMEAYNIHEFTVMNMRDIYKQIFSYRKDHTIFAILSEKINLSGLNDIMRGLIKGEEAKKVMEGVYFVLRVIDKISTSQTDNLQEMDSIFNEAYQQAIQTGNTYDPITHGGQEIEQPQQTTMEDLDSLIGSMGIGDIPIQTDIPTGTETDTNDQTNDLDELNIDFLNEN